MHPCLRFEKAPASEGGRYTGREQALMRCYTPIENDRVAGSRYTCWMGMTTRSAQGHGAMHGTTVLCVRKDNKAVLVADGQVTIGDHVMKHTARKTRRLYNDKVIAGFAGSTADAISLFERFEGKLQEHSGNLQKASVELAKEWRKDRALRHLEALLIVADTKATFVLSGNGDVIEPDDGLCAIGSGGTYALAAARAMMKHSKLSTKEVAMEAMRIASEICIYTNANFTVEEI
jgi:ATP-dependent HslUV protease, peptidase subunit HslV